MQWCNYAILDKDGNTLRHVENICFRDMTYNKYLNEKSAFIHYYIPVLRAHLQSPEIFEMLKKFGYEFEYKGVVKGFEDKHSDSEFHLLELDLSNFTKNFLMLLITMTILRTVDEQILNANKYFKLKRKYPDIPDDEIFQLALNIGVRGNHVINRGLYRYYNYSELKDAALYASKGKNLWDGGEGVQRATCVFENYQLSGINIDNIKSYYNQFKRIDNININKNIYIVGGDKQYASWLEDFNIVDNLEDAGLVMFTGGEDVDPIMYKEPKHPSTFSNLKRDIREKEIFTEAKRNNKKMIGICRGSQFLCVMAGGSLVQDQPNPNYMHEIITTSGDRYVISSTHHQAQDPRNLIPYKAKLLAWNATQLPYRKNGNDNNKRIQKDAEIVYYRNIKALGIQGHPEHLGVPNETLFYLRGLVSKLLDNSL